MRAIVNGDLIEAMLSGDSNSGVMVPVELIGIPIERLRFDGVAVMDAGGIDYWHIDAIGNKHLPSALPAGEPLSCSYDTPIVRRDGVWIVVDAAAELVAAKNRTKLLVDEAAERARLAYITPGAGQSMVYREKSDEAMRLLDDPDPSPANYPILSASIGIEGDTLADIATLVLQTRTQWLTVAGAIETARLTAKQTIDVAADKEAVAAAQTAALVSIAAI